MTMEEIRGLYFREPFRPFTLVLNTGEQIRIDQIEWLSINPTGYLTAFRADDSLAFAELDAVVRVIEHSDLAASGAG
jgi:hypothetical protein